MKKWQSSLWIMLTLVALFATTLPSLVWACPMTGQIGDAATICQGAMPQTGISDIQPCADPHRCCKPLSLPNNNERNQSTGAATQNRLIGAPAQSLQTSQISAGVAAVLPSSFTLFVAPQRSGLRPAALLPLRSQHRPHAAAGRAPPVL